MAIITLQQTDTTVRIFDNFYSYKLTINASEWDAVHSYFAGTTKNKQIANNFASLLFRIAQEGGYSVMDLLATIQGTNTTLQMNQVICYYLNTFRAKASLYGVGLIPKPNEAVQRNVVL
jgi:cupin superfamily acireductone dioxygenase involved in methionine salvage